MSVPKLYSVALGEWLDIGLAAGSYGGALYTAGTGRSSYHTVIGDLARDEQEFRFSGMDGKFVELHGISGRQISWTGNLRVTAAALTTILAQREDFRRTDGVFTFTDDDSTSYANCRIRSFELSEKRRIFVPGANLDWLVPYVISLEQLKP